MLKCREAVAVERVNIHAERADIREILRHCQNDIASVSAQLLQHAQTIDSNWKMRYHELCTQHACDSEVAKDQILSINKEKEILTAKVSRLESEICAAQQVNSFVLAKQQASTVTTPVKISSPTQPGQLKPQTPTSNAKRSSSENSQLQQQMQQHQQQIGQLQSQIMSLQQSHAHVLSGLQQTINQQQFKIHQQRTELEHSIEYFKRSAAEAQVSAQLHEQSLSTLRAQIYTQAISLVQAVEKLPDTHALELKCTQHHAHVKDLGRVATIRELTIERDSLIDEMKRAK
jgi:hypothetical protein